VESFKNVLPSFPYVCDKEIMIIRALGKFSTNANRFFVCSVALQPHSWQGNRLVESLYIYIYAKMQLRVRKNERRTIFIVIRARATVSRLSLERRLRMHA
jgi:hypothetical protein